MQLHACASSAAGTYTHIQGWQQETFCYTPAGSPINGVNNPTFQYDANGNMTSGAGRTVAWTSFNMAGSVTSNGNTLALTYDPEHGRIKQCVPDCTSPQTTTIYLNDGATGAMAERYSNNGVTWRTMIVADGKLVARPGCSDISAGTAHKHVSKLWITAGGGGSRSVRRTRAR